MQFILVIQNITNSTNKKEMQYFVISHKFQMKLNFI